MHPVEKSDLLLKITRSCDLLTKVVNFFVQKKYGDTKNKIDRKGATCFEKKTSLDSLLSNLRTVEIYTVSTERSQGGRSNNCGLDNPLHDETHDQLPTLQAESASAQDSAGVSQLRIAQGSVTSAKDGAAP